MSKPTFTTGRPKPPKKKASEMKTLRDVWSRWYGKALIGTAGFLAVIFVLAAVFAPASEKDEPAAVANGKAAESGFDRPTAAERSELLNRLYAIDGRMRDNPERYVDRSINTCQMLTSNKDWTDARFVSTTVTRFQGGTMPDFSEGQARKALAAVRETFCD